MVDVSVHWIGIDRSRTPQRIVAKKDMSSEVFYLIMERIIFIIQLVHEIIEMSKKQNKLLHLAQRKSRIVINL